VDLTGNSVLSAFEPAANRSDRRRRWIVPAVLLLSLVYGSPVIAEAYRPELGLTLRQLDKSADAILTFQSRAGAQGARKGLPNTSCVYEISGDSFEFGKLVSMMVSDTFALGSENSFGALPPDNFESNISIVFTRAGHELLTSKDFNVTNANPEDRAALDLV
jgi:hypothetical protein